jgi:hypothetical protein
VDNGTNWSVVKLFADDWVVHSTYQYRRDAQAAIDFLNAESTSYHGAHSAPYFLVVGDARKVARS